MKLVKESMIDGREHDANARDKSDSAEKRIAPGEKFARIGLDRRERAHAGKYHRGIRERVQPRKFFEIVITGHPDAE